MEAAFSWLGQIFEAILLLVPRIVIVRATHGGVKWRNGSGVKIMKPGLHCYWPLVTEIELIAVARQTFTPQKQTLTTKDGTKVIVGTVVVCCIRDIEQAVGRINWDIGATINDITQAAVVSVIAKRTYREILDLIITGELNKFLKDAAQKDLHQFGVTVSQCKLIDFSDCRVIRLVTDANLSRVTGEE